MKKKPDLDPQFVVCVVDSEPDLERRKVYQVVPDESARRSHHLRIVDESGEDYLYPARYFVSVRVPKGAKPALLLAS